MSSDYTCEIYTLNAGRGDATLFIETENGETFTTMIDCGPQQSDEGIKNLKEFLMKKKIMEEKTENIKLNALILTHEDVDHVEFLMKHFYSKTEEQNWEEVFSNIEHFFVSDGVLTGKHSQGFFEYLEYLPNYLKREIWIDYPYRNFIIAPRENQVMYHYFKTEQNIYGADSHAPRPQYDTSVPNANSLLVYYTHPNSNIDNNQLFIFSADSLANFILEKNDKLGYTNNNTRCLFFKVPHHGSKMNSFNHLDKYNNKLDLKNVVFPLQAVSLCILCFRWKQMRGIVLTDKERCWHIRFSAGVSRSVHDIDIDYYALKILPIVMKIEDIERFLETALKEFRVIATTLSTAKDLESGDILQLKIAFDALKELISSKTIKKNYVLLSKSFFQQNNFLSSLWWRHLIARFYKKINAKYYIISCYTSHGHPHMETITGIILAAQQNKKDEKIILITNTSTSLKKKLELLQAEVKDFLPYDDKLVTSNVQIIQSNDNNSNTLFDVNKGIFPNINDSEYHTKCDYQTIQTSKYDTSFNFTIKNKGVEQEFRDYQFFIGGRPLNLKFDESTFKFPRDPFELCLNNHQSYNIFQWNNQYDSDYTWFTIVPCNNVNPGCFIQAISKDNHKDEYYFFTQTYKTFDLNTNDDKIMETMIEWSNNPEDIIRRPSKSLRVLDLYKPKKSFQLTTTSLAKAQYPMTWEKTPKNYSTSNINSFLTLSYEDSSLIRYLEIIAYDYKDSVEKTKLQKILEVLLPSPLFLLDLIEQCKLNPSIFSMLSWQIDVSSSTAIFSNNQKPCLNNIMLHLIVPSNSIYKFNSDFSQPQKIIETTFNGIFEDIIKVDFKIKTEGEQNDCIEYQLSSSKQSIITRPITFLINITDHKTITVMDVLAYVLSYGRAIRSTYHWPTFFYDIDLPNWTIDINPDSKSSSSSSLVFYPLSALQAILNVDKLIPTPLGTKSILNPPSNFIKEKVISLFINLPYFQPIIDNIELYTFQSTKQNLPACSVLLSDSNVWLKIIGKLEDISIHIWMPANKEDDIQILLPKIINSQDCTNFIAKLIAKQNNSDPIDNIDWISTMKLPLLGDVLKDFELLNIGLHIRRKLVEMEDMEVNKLYFTIHHPLADYWTNKILKLLPGSPSISIQQPEISVDISYPLEYNTNKSFISYTIDFWLTFVSSSPLFIRFSKQSRNINGSDINEKRFELFISNEMNITPVYSRQPDILNGIIDYKISNQTDLSPPTLRMIFNSFGLSSFIDLLPCVSQLINSTELELMNISCVSSNDDIDIKYTWDYLHFILRVSEFKFESNIPLLKYFRFIDSQFDFECLTKNQWKFSMNTIVNIDISDIDFVQCAINLSYTTNNISTFDFSIRNEDEKLTLACLLQIIGIEQFNNIPLFNNLLHNLAIIKFNCICNSNKKDSFFELEHLSIQVNYTDSFTIGNLTFNDLSITINYDLKHRDENEKYDISVSFTGILNCLSVEITYDSSTRILSGLAQGISDEVGLKQTLECFIIPNKDQSLENDAVLSSILDYKQFGLNFLKFEIQLLENCILKSALIDLSGSISIPIFQLSLQSLRVEYKHTDSQLQDIYSSAQINLIAILSRLKFQAEIHIECNKKIIIPQISSSESITIVKGQIIPIKYNSLTFENLINLFSWIIPNSTDKINNEISLLKTIQIQSASIELTTETNQPWCITFVQCIVEGFRNIIIYEQNPNIILKDVSLCVEYKDKRDSKVFFYLNGKIKIGGVEVSASYYWTEKQLIIAIIESDKAKEIQLSQLTEQYIDNKEIDHIETNLIPLPDTPTGFIPLKISSESYIFVHLNLTDLKYIFYGRYEQMTNGILYINKDTSLSSKNSYVFVVRIENEFKFEKLFQSGNLHSLAKIIDKILTIEIAIIYINSFPTKTIQSINEDIDNAIKDLEYDTKNSSSTSSIQPIVSPFLLNNSKIPFTSLKQDFGPGCFVYIRLKMDTLTSSNALKNLIAICSTREPIEMIGYFPKKFSDDDNNQSIEFIGRNFTLILLGNLQISVREMKYIAKQTIIDRNDELFIFSIDGSLSVIWDLSLLQNKQLISQINGINFNLKIYDKQAIFSVDLISDIISPFGLANITIKNCRFYGKYEFELEKKFNYHLEGIVVLQSSTNKELDISLQTKLYFHSSSLIPIAVCINLKDKKINLLELLIKLLTLNTIDNVDFLDICVVDKIYGCCLDTFSSSDDDDEKLELKQGARFTIDLFEIFQILVEIIAIENTYEIIGTATKPFDLILFQLKHHQTMGKNGQGPTVKYSIIEKTFFIYFSIAIGDYTISEIEFRYIFNENKFMSRIILVAFNNTALDISWNKSSGFQWTLVGFEGLKTLIDTIKFTQYLKDMLNTMETDLCGTITNLILEDTINGTMSASFRFKKSSANENTISNIFLILGCTLEIHLANSNTSIITVPISEIEIELKIPSIPSTNHVTDVLSFMRWLIDIIIFNMDEFFQKFAKNPIEVFKILGILTASKFTRELLTKLACRIPKNTLLKDLGNLATQATKELAIAIGDMAIACAALEGITDIGICLVLSTAAGIAIKTVLNLFVSLGNLLSNDDKEKKPDIEKKLQDNFNNIADKVLTLSNSQTIGNNTYPFKAIMQRSDKIKNDGVNGYDEILVCWETLSKINNYSFTYYVILVIRNDNNPSSSPFQYFKETSENTIVFNESEILTSSHFEIHVQARCKIITEQNGKILEVLFRGPGMKSDHPKTEKPVDEKFIDPFYIDKYPNLPSPQLKSCTYIDGKIHLEFEKVNKAIAYKIDIIQNNNHIVFSTTISDNSNIISWSELICNIPGDGNDLYTFNVRAIALVNSNCYDSLSVKFPQEFKRENSPQNIELEYEQISEKLILKWKSLENISYTIQTENSSNMIEIEKSFSLLNPDSDGFGTTSFNFHEIFPNFDDISLSPWSLYIYTEGTFVIMNSSKILLKDKIAYADISPLTNIKFEADNIKQQVNISFDHPINSKDIKYKYILMNISNPNKYIEITNEISLNKTFQWLYSLFQSSIENNQLNKYQVIINILFPLNNLEFILKSNQSFIEGQSNELIRLPKISQLIANYDNIKHCIKFNFNCPILTSDLIANKIGYNIKWNKSDLILFLPIIFLASNFELISVDSQTTKILSKFDINTKCLSVELYIDPNKIIFLGKELSIQGSLIIETVTIENINYMNSESVNSSILDISFRLATPQNLKMICENKNPLLNQFRIQCDEISHANQYHFSINSSINNTNSSEIINLFNKISNQPSIEVSLYELLNPFISSSHYYSASVFVFNTDLHLEKSSTISIPMNQWIPSLKSPTQATISYSDDDNDKIILKLTSVIQDNLMINKFDCYCMDLISLSSENEIIVHDSFQLKPIQDNNSMNLYQKIDIREELGIKIDSRKEYFLYLRCNSNDSLVISSLPFLIPESKIKFLSVPEIYSLHSNNDSLNFDTILPSYSNLEIIFKYDKQIKYLLVKLIQHDKILISSKLYPRTIDSTDDDNTKSIVEFILTDLSIKDRSKTEDRQFIIVAYGSSLLSLPSSSISIDSVLQLPAPDRLSLIQNENDGINLNVTIITRIPVFSGQLPVGSYLQLTLLWFPDESTDLSDAIACKSLENILINETLTEYANQIQCQYILSKEDLTKFTTKETVMGIKARLRIENLNFFFNSYETISTDLVKFIPSTL